MIKRKFLIAVLCLAVILSIPITAVADTETTVSVSYPDEVAVGDTLEVVVSINGNPGINAIDLVLEYDRSTLKCLECEAGAVIQDMMTVQNPAHSRGAYVGAASLTAAKSDGILATVRFKVISKGEYDLKINLILADKDGNEISFSVKNEENGETEVNDFESPRDDQELPNKGQDQEGERKLPFNDVSGHWALEYILRSYDEKLFLGYDGNSFGPDKNITRAEFVTVLWRYFGSPEPKGKSSFIDLDPKADYYHKAVAWAEEEKIFNGVGGGRFSPDGYITREQLAAVLHRIDGNGIGAEIMYAGIYDSAFVDSAKVSDWAKPSVYWTVYHDLWCGRGAINVGKRLEPQLPATRAEIAVMVMKYTNFAGGIK